MQHKTGFAELTINLPDEHPVSIIPVPVGILDNILEWPWAQRGVRVKIGDVTRGEYIRNEILVVSSWRVSDMFEVSPCPSVTHGTVMILVLSLCNK